MIRALCALLFSLNAHADLLSVTLKAKVKSFTKDKVTLQASGKTFQVDRSQFGDKKLMSGDTVEVTLEGDEAQKVGLPKN